MLKYCLGRPLLQRFAYESSILMSSSWPLINQPYNIFKIIFKTAQINELHYSLAVRAQFVFIDGKRSAAIAVAAHSPEDDIDVRLRLLRAGQVGEHFVLLFTAAASTTSSTFHHRRKCGAVEH